jgi:hypothetical protein
MASTKNWRYLITFLLPWLIVASSCQKVDVEKGTPGCIKKKIRKGEIRCVSEIKRYTYHGQTVYVFMDNAHNCDDASMMIMDEKCKVLCVLGGIAGVFNDPGCPNFWQDAHDPVTVWTE